MSDSLKDQLVALGLARQPSENTSGRRRKRRAGKSGSSANSNREISLDEAFRLRDREEKQSREAAKAAKQAIDRERRLLNKKIEAIVEAHGQNDPKAELKRNFLFKGRIRSVLVNAEQLKSLNDGDLALVFLRGRYFVVSPEVAEQVRKLSLDHVPDLSAGGDSDEDEHPVPDDLVW